MADNLERIRSLVNRGVTTINIKTSFVLEKSKIKTNIETIVKENEKIYLNIGKMFYELWKDDSENYSALNKQCESIKENDEEISRLMLLVESINEQNNKILGLNEETSKAINDNESICANCGSKYSLPVRFCRKCGKEM